MPTHVIVWTIAALATAGVILRPFGWREAIWAVAGAVVLVGIGFLTPHEALAGIGKGTDVYLFLIGMMLIAELAREEGLFDWLAAHATRSAKGSANRLFFLIYGVGTVVTVFLSNDATAVVLTPAVAAAVRTARVKDPMPYLLICAFIANAASFVLPISNPANLVIYGQHMPPLFAWLPQFFLPSVVSIVVTFVALRLAQRSALTGPIATDVDVPPLSRPGRFAALGIAFTAIVLLIASWADLPLGLPTTIAGALTVAAVLLVERKSPWYLLKGISWDVLPLVAGLFILVEALDKTGLVTLIGNELKALIATSETSAVWATGLGIAFLCNLMNNLPAGLIAGDVISAVHPPANVTAAALIGIDLGPNLSVTGSLATILWLTALKRDGHGISTGSFLKLGFLVMTPALVLTLASLTLMR